MKDMIKLIKEEVVESYSFLVEYFLDEVVFQRFCSKNSQVKKGEILKSDVFVYREQRKFKIGIIDQCVLDLENYQQSFVIFFSFLVCDINCQENRFFFGI